MFYIIDMCVLHVFFFSLKVVLLVKCTPPCVHALNMCVLHAFFFKSYLSLSVRPLCARLFNMCVHVCVCVFISNFTPREE